MTAHGERRGNMVYHWRHGWIPLDHTAALSKAKGNHEAAKGYLPDRKAGSNPAHPSVQAYSSMSNADKIRAAEIMHGTGSKQHEAAKVRFGAKTKPAPVGHPSLKPSVQAHLSMSNADKIRAAARMYGTGSKQHLAAKKRFGPK